MINRDKEGVKSSIKAVGFILSAVLIFSFCFLIGTVIRARLQSSATTVEDGERVEENSNLTYYLKVKYDGVDRVGVESSDSVVSSVYSDVINVSDKLPEGLYFYDFVTTPTGTIGAVERGDGVTPCSGQVIDDTGSTTGWSLEYGGYVYHGLHYDYESRTVSFKVKNLMAGCQLTVGIITRTPTLPTGVIRMDFYNTAGFIEGDLRGNSNTSHTYIGKKDVATHQVLYEYTGTVPDGAPAAPSETRYMDGATVRVEKEPEMNGYDFSGWTTSDATISSGQFTMPENTVTLRGSFTAKPTYTLGYLVTGDTPDGYHAPNSRSYGEGDIVAIDSSAAGDVIDGYRFSGWTTSDATITDGTITMPAGNVTLTGSFTKIDYAVSYQFEGSVMPSGAGSLLPATTRYYPGDTVTTAAKPTASGYTFLGWYKSDSFKMPEEDVVIYGEWQEISGSFRPSITQVITNPKDDYRITETVKFKITVTNPESFPINDVNIGLNLPGVVFTADSAYTKRAEQLAKIDTLAAGASVVLYAEYPVTEDLTKTYTSVAQIMSATAGNDYVMDTSDEAMASYMASTSFNTLSWNDIPVFTGVNMGNLLPFLALVLLGAMGGFMTVLRIKKAKVATREKIVLAEGRRNASSKNSGKMARRIIIPAFAGLLLIAGLLVIGRNVLADNSPTKSVELTSQNTNFANNAPGAWNIQKSAKWIGEGKARITFDLDTIEKASGNYKDVLLVLDNSGSMDGDKLNRVKEDASELVDSLLSDSNNRVALVKFSTTAAVLSDFTNDKTTILGMIDSLRTEGMTNYYDAILKMESIFSNYTQSVNRDAVVLFLTDGYPCEQTPQEVSEYKYFTSSYGYVSVRGIQYEMDNVVLYPITTVSDEQYIAHMDTLENVLFEASRTSLTYSEFIVKDYIDSNYFDQVLDTDSTRGTVTVSGNEVQWDLSNNIKSGIGATLTIDVKLKNGVTPNADGLLPTNQRETMKSKLSGVPDENFYSIATPKLKLNYEVKYQSNAPSGCTLGGTVPAAAEQMVYSTVEISSNKLTCAGYTFNGWVIATDGVESLNSDYFIMPEKDVTLVAIWSSASIEKSMDGTVLTTTSTQLDTGASVNMKLKKAAGQNNPATYTSNSNVKAIKMADKLPVSFAPTTDNTISLYGNMPVYVWLEDDTLYLFTGADKIYLNSDSSRLFDYFNNLEDISAFGSMDASRMQNMNSMFYYCKMLTDLSPISDWDTSSVTSMSNTFSYMYNLTDLTPLADWDVTSVENMHYIISNNHSLVSLHGLERWQTYSLNDLTGAFSQNDSLEDISALMDWDVSGIDSLAYTFYLNPSLADLTGLNNWNVSNVKSMEETFYYDRAIASLTPLARWNTSSVETMKQMFWAYSYQSPPALTSLRGLDDWNVSSVTDMSDMFDGHTNLASLEGIEKWDVSSVKNMSLMFSGDSGTSRFTTLEPLKNWNTASLERVDGMFRFNPALTNISALESVQRPGNNYVSWNMSNVSNMSSLFSDTSITDFSVLATWDTSSLSSMYGMFSDSKISDLTPIANWNVSGVSSMYALFQRASQLSDLSPISGWNMSGVTNIGYMFSSTNVSDLTPISGWDVSGVTALSYLFYKCGSLMDASPIENWSIRSSASMTGVFSYTGVEYYPNWYTGS